MKREDGMGLRGFLREIREKADPEKAKMLLRFFKTGPGEYAEGDRFLGVVVPVQRELVKKYSSLTQKEIFKLVRSPIHEERLSGLLIWVEQFRRGGEREKQTIFRAYLKHTRFINNWDLVDLSAPAIVGGYLEGRGHSLLKTMARSSVLWERRIAILATFYFIKRNSFQTALALSKILLQDHHDLIHKAVGWMLREIGKRDLKTEEVFLRRFYRQMPRTMLRYAIEKFPETKRQAYLRGTR